MKTQKLLHQLKGIQTIKSVMTLLEIDKPKAIYYIHRLRKLGYVKTKKKSNNERIYSISHQNKIKGKDYYEVLNEISPVKLATQSSHKIYGRKITFEETLIFAIKTKSLRVILSSLALFKKINNWTTLYQLSKQNNLEREVGALYDLSRKIIKTRKMTKRFRTLSLPKNNEKYKFILEKFKSNNFKDVEKHWKIYLPFNKADLEDYK